MGLFNREKVHTQLFETLSRRILQVEQEQIILKQKITSLELENDDLRNKVLRKIQKKAPPEEENSFVLGGAVKRR